GDGDDVVERGLGVVGHLLDAQRQVEHGREVEPALGHLLLDALAEGLDLFVEGGHAWLRARVADGAPRGPQRVWLAPMAAMPARATCASSCGLTPETPTAPTTSPSTTISSPPSMHCTGRCRPA